MRYPYKEIEEKWQKYWEDNKVYKTDLTNTKDKLYSLVMFIYPSGAKLHCGHWYNYGPNDSWARFKKLKGYNVFEPMGYDAFGLPAENYAVKTGIHPYDSTMTNIDDIRVQLKSMGCMYDWDSELKTCEPEYYKWNQWLFLQLYKKGLAYRKNAPVNWCPKDQTVLANEQVLSDGSCERCGTTVIQKNLTQWFFKITDYAEELLSGLEEIQWPETTKKKQRNWIGKSTGADVKFKIVDSDKTMTVFTTRPDTLFGVTYVVIAPENPLVNEIVKEEYKEGVANYIDSVKSLTEIERTSTVKEKTGVPTGAYVINPVNGEKVPVWISDYVLATYGTGCVMAVPGHDERDFEFATKFNLPIKKVILIPGGDANAPLTEAYTDPGIMINSGKYTGTESIHGIIQIITDLEAANAGSKKVNYKLRDWLISRQRYWGTPIPIIHCPKCGEVPVPEDELPVKLPYDVEFKPNGMSPLAGNDEFMNVKCPKCGTDSKRDPDTMDTFVDSSWYYFRYLNPKISDSPFDKDLAGKWTPVNMYVGGAEHATMHLLYARFIHKFFRDLGYVHSKEPFSHLVHQGTITNQGAKMSKSKGNVVSPNQFTSKFGTDVFRLYLMFMGPYEQGGDWSDKGITGTERFVQRCYDLFFKYENLFIESELKDSFDMHELKEEEKSVYKRINQTIKKFDEEIDHFRFNTAIASLMELLNELTRNLESCSKGLQLYALERLNIMIAPIAPHLAEECRSLLGSAETIFEHPVWYEPDPAALVEENVNIAVQVNGKLRSTISIGINLSQEQAKSIVFADEKVAKHLEGKAIVKEIYVKNKIYNIVVK
ncbi:MAG: leucine--tRNA ligase [Bacteroidota bacterium]|nr:leucine--tRNA ligase [Bacteroidota bacterium]